MHISLCARSKILQLTSVGKCFRVLSTGLNHAGSTVDLISDAEPSEFDVTISHIPRVIADLATINEMLNQDIDFDYKLDEFIISNRKLE